jgi:hypothetical protein
MQGNLSEWQIGRTLRKTQTAAEAAVTNALRDKIFDLILRSLRSKRLEGWTQRMDSQPSFETRRRRRFSG